MDNKSNTSVTMAKKKKILFISAFLPDDKIPHAGGQTFNYYVKGLQSTGLFSITVIIVNNEFSTDAEKYGIKTVVIPEKRDILSRIGNTGYHINPWHKYGNLVHTSAICNLMNGLKLLKSHGYVPDVIIFEWTEMLLTVKQVKKIFPAAYYVASEHDVTYLRYRRKIDHSNSWKFRILRLFSYYNMKHIELDCLSYCTLIKTHNEKDKRLLVSDGISSEHISPLSAFYHDYSDVIYNDKSHNILFFGAMARLENSESALWFIHKVMPLLDNVRFIVIGGNPPESLKKWASNKIVITGFVEDIKGYFSDALCMVVPLQNGAGIKVKVLEAMSAGIPVLTNEIGIEGIPAKAESEYLLCHTPEDYKKAITNLIDGTINGNTLSKNGRSAINRNFNLKESLRQYSKELQDLGE